MSIFRHQCAIKVPHEREVENIRAKIEVMLNLSISTLFSSLHLQVNAHSIAFSSQFAKSTADVHCETLHLLKSKNKKVFYIFSLSRSVEKLLLRNLWCLSLFRFFFENLYTHKHVKMLKFCKCFLMLQREKEIFFMSISI